MEATRGSVASLRTAEHERREAVERLAMIDASLRAHRRAQHWSTARRLLAARGGVYRQLLEINARGEDLGGEPLPRRRFERSR